MSQLGARFREAREARGLTIAEAAAETRILARYLQALEDGDFEQLPGDVYARGFIRNYAQFLDLPADELIQVYRRERGAPTEKIRVVPAAVPPRTRSCLLPSAFFTFFSILVLLGVLYWIANLAGLTRLPEIAEQPTATVAPPTATAFPTATELPEGTPPSRLPPTPTAPRDTAVPTAIATPPAASATPTAVPPTRTPSPPARATRTLRNPPPSETPASGFAARKSTSDARSSSVMIALARRRNSGSSTTVCKRVMPGSGMLP